MYTSIPKCRGILRDQLKISKLFYINVIRINDDLCIALMNPIKNHFMHSLDVSFADLSI